MVGECWGGKVGKAGSAPGVLVRAVVALPVLLKDG